MRRTRGRFPAVVVPALALVVLAAAQPAAADVKITDRPYVRHDGGTDATIASCSNDARNDVLAGGERQANEPSAAIDPNDARRMVAGSNDYCALPTNGDAWAGFYYSTDRGQTWTNSLLPGYASDTSAEGSNCTISPQHCSVLATGDPMQAFDRFGHVFYGVIGFNRVRPSNGSIFVARYDWTPGTAPDYRRTTLVERGTPTPANVGLFQDKVALEADRGVASPFAGGPGRPWGNVYVCWTRFTASAANNGVFLSRSTDGGVTFSPAQKLSSNHGSQFCDLGVTATGRVYVSWRQFAFKPAQGQAQGDAVLVTWSDDGGRTFAKPVQAASFVPWDVGDVTADPERGDAERAACLAGDFPEQEACGREVGAPEVDAPAGDCGDGPFVCDSGYVFFRESSMPRLTADPTDTAHPRAAYVVFNATVPGTQTPTGTTYGTVASGIGSQGQVFFTRTDTGPGWTAPTRVTPAQAKGHQFFPDIDANAGRLHVLWQDSRDDTASGPPTTPSGGDFRTVPIANRWVPANPPGSVSVGPGVGVQSFYATSSDRGASFTERLVSSAAQMPQYEQFGDRDIPFFGDYNSIAAVGDTVLMDWTDQRDPVETKPGTDPRYTDGDGTDGFDVLQCRPAADPFGPDQCPNAGGLDQNIFGFVARPAP
jgi:hypothetical protein